MKTAQKIVALSAFVLVSSLATTTFARTAVTPERRGSPAIMAEVVPAAALEALAPRVGPTSRSVAKGQSVQLRVHLLDLKKTLTRAYLKRQKLPHNVRVRGLFHTATGELHVTFSRGRRGQVMIFRPFGETVIASYHGTFTP